MPLAARWVEPSRRKTALSAYAADAESKTLDLLDRSLAAAGGTPSRVIERKLLDAAGRDVEELLPQLAPRAAELAARAVEKLRQRGDREARNLVDTLEGQRKRVLAELAKHDKHPRQMTLGFSTEEKRQLESDVRAWRLRLEQFDRDLASEPDRIRDFYEIRARRVEPVGLVYLWPETN